MDLPIEAVKKPNTIESYTPEQKAEIAKCVDDPLYFMRTFMRIQTPKDGAVAFEPYPFQEKMIRGFADNQYSIALTARQMGKCLTFYTKINVESNIKNIGDLIVFPLRKKIIAWLEGILVWLAV